MVPEEIIYIWTFSVGICLCDLVLKYHLYYTEDTSILNTET